MKYQIYQVTLSDEIYREVNRLGHAKAAEMKATYKGVEYFVISTFAEMIELAPTQHGAGSFMVHIDYCVFNRRK